jgi:NADPH2:quinone reductase
LTDGKGVHAVYDGVGKDTFDEDFEVVRSRGTLVMYGNASVCLPSIITYIMFRMESTS